MPLRLLSILLLLSLPVFAADLVVKTGEGLEVTLNAAALELLPHQQVKAAAPHGGQECVWSGVPLYQVLQQAGFAFGDSLRGAALSQYVLITAADGYRVVFALPELDPRCTDDPVLLVDECNGSPLPAEDGPLRLVLPKERRHFRWVRQVVKIEVRKVDP